MSTPAQQQCERSKCVRCIPKSHPYATPLPGVEAFSNACSCEPSSHVHLSSVSGLPTVAGYAKRDGGSALALSEIDDHLGCDRTQQRPAAAVFSGR